MSTHIFFLIISNYESLNQVVFIDNIAYKTCRTILLPDFCCFYLPLYIIFWVLFDSLKSKQISPFLSRCKIKQNTNFFNDNKKSILHLIRPLLHEKNIELKLQFQKF